MGIRTCAANGWLLASVQCYVFIGELLFISVSFPIYSHINAKPYQKGRAVGGGYRQTVCCVTVVVIHLLFQSVIF